MIELKLEYVNLYMYMKKFKLSSPTACTYIPQALLVRYLHNTYSALSEQWQTADSLLLLSRKMTFWRICDVQQKVV